MDNESLIAAARHCVGEFPLSAHWRTAGGVASALVTEAGNVYTGICIDLDCSVGFCAEHSAIAAMLKERETVIKKIVAVTVDRIVPPCGRCRELMGQVDLRNTGCEILLPDGESVTLEALLPRRWAE
jgi:cytidine deaminase